MTNTHAPSPKVIPHPRSLRHALELAEGSHAPIVFHTTSGAIDHTLTYGELAERAKRYARRLLQAGCQPGDYVGLMAETNEAFLTAFYGCQYAGLVAVPLPLAVFMGGLEPYLEQTFKRLAICKASLLIASDRIAPTLQEHAPATLRVLSYAEAAALSDGDELPLPDEAPGTPAYVQFSSGSTNFPKGILISQTAVCQNAFDILTSGLALTEADRAFSWLPFYHDMGLVGFSIAPLVGLCPIHYLAPSTFVRRPGLWPELIGRHGCTISYAPPFAYRLAAQRASTLDPAIRLDQWRVAGVGGDDVRADSLDGFAQSFAPMGFKETAFLPSYGLAEAVLAVSFAHRDEPLARLTPEGASAPLIGCGPPLPSLELAIRDETGQAVAPGKAGTLHVRGPSVCAAHLADTGAEVSQLDPQGFLDTGDIGFLQDGNLYISGRSKDLIIFNGRNVWPADIEAEIEARAGIKFGDVVAFETGKDQDQTITVLVEMAEKDRASADQLTARIAAIANSHCGMPVEVHIVPRHTITRTSSGKIARRAAHRQFCEGELTLPSPQVAD